MLRLKQYENFPTIQSEQAYLTVAQSVKQASRNANC
jgi:hypothetical protein